jgi:tetratricopeptide (TPR) repeat protein
VAKRIHRTKIDEDQFVVRSGELFAAALPIWEKHKTLIVRGLIGLAAAIVVLFLAISYLHKSADRTQAALDEALAAAEAPRPDAQASEPAAQTIGKLEAFLRDHPSGTSAAWAHFHLAQQLLEQGQAEPAVEHYRKFLEIGPREGSGLGHLGLGFALLRSGKPGDAISEWEGLKSSGWDADALTLEIATARMQTDRQKGIEELQALADKKDSPFAAEAKQRLQLYSTKADTAPVIKGAPEPAAEAEHPAATPQSATAAPAGAATPQPARPAAPEKATPVPAVPPAEPTPGTQQPAPASGAEAQPTP